MVPPPPIPPSFQTLKSRILSSLSTPTSTYTDASPKGSLDTAIVPLIERLNALDGIVTTSSCAGRVSVFLEGRRGSSGGRGNTSREGGDVGECEDHEDNGRRMKMKKSVPGGKGLGGRWLFVSHDPLELPKDENGRDDEAPLTKMFGLTRDVTENENMNGEVRRSRDRKNVRFVRFAFEPMVSLAHTLCASEAFRSCTAYRPGVVWPVKLMLCLRAL